MDDGRLFVVRCVDALDTCRSQQFEQPVGKPVGQVKPLELLLGPDPLCAGEFAQVFHLHVEFLAPQGQGP